MKILVYNDNKIDLPEFDQEINNKLYEYCNFGGENNNSNHVNSNNFNNSLKSTILIPSFQDINNAVFAYNPNFTTKHESNDVNSEFEQGCINKSLCSNVFNSNLKNLDLLKAKLIIKK